MSPLPGMRLISAKRSSSGAQYRVLRKRHPRWRRLRERRSRRNIEWPSKVLNARRYAPKCIGIALLSKPADRVLATSKARALNNAASPTARASISALVWRNVPAGANGRQPNRDINVAAGSIEEAEENAVPRRRRPARKWPMRIVSGGHVKSSSSEKCCTIENEWHATGEQSKRRRGIRPMPR